MKLLTRFFFNGLGVSLQGFILLFQFLILLFQRTILLLDLAVFLALLFILDQTVRAKNHVIGQKTGEQACAQGGQFAAGTNEP